MPAPFARKSLLWLAPLLAVIALGVALLGNATAKRNTTASTAAASKAYSIKLTYDETNHGQEKGAATVGIVGKGKFSAKLGPHAALAAAVIALATGVPVTKIAEGGSYKLRRQIAGNGVITGVSLITFKAHGLGTLCLSYTTKPGKFKLGDSFVPMSGSVKTVGGTGAAKKWNGGASYKQTNVTGASTETLSLDGSEHVSVGKAHGLSAACKHA